jgi:transposase
MIFVGDDWAEAHHDVHVMDEAGKRLASRRLPEGLEGIRRFHELVGDLVENPDEVVVGIETDRGLWVHALSAAGYQVFAINPLAVARYRDRHNVGGAKSDAGDAKVLADLVRTDRHNHRAIAADSPEAEAIKVLARGHQNLIWARNRQTNQLRSALREYYPAALNAFDDLAHRDALAVLGRAPTPEAGAALSLSQLRSVLERGGRQRNLDRRAAQIQSALRAEHLGAPSALAQAFAATTKATVGIIGELNRGIAELEAALEDRLSSTRTPTSTSPCQDSVMCSAPGCSASSGMPPIDTPVPSLARTTPARHLSRSPRARNGRSWPVMCATGASTMPSTSGRSVPSRRVGDAAPSTTSTGRRATCTTRPSGLSGTASSASSTAASTPAPATTSNRPGVIATRMSSRPLDKLRPWGV